MGPLRFLLHPLNGLLRIHLNNPLRPLYYTLGVAKKGGMPILLRLSISKERGGDDAICDGCLSLHEIVHLASPPIGAIAQIRPASQPR